MRWDENSKEKIVSEGKILEIMPILIDVFGQPFSLPPIHFELDNELLGYEKYHVLSAPMQFITHERIRIPGSMANRTTDVQIFMRLLEGGKAAHVNKMVDKEALHEFLDILKVMPKTYGPR